MIPLQGAGVGLGMVIQAYFKGIGNIVLPKLNCGYILIIIYILFTSYLYISFVCII